MRVLFDDKSAVLMMSDEEESLGTLLSANPTACNVLGRTAAELVGSNVCMLLPPPFADAYHAVLLDELREASAGALQARQSTIMVLHKRGHVFPARLITKHVVTGFGKPMMVAIINPIEASEGEHCACVNARTGQIMRCSAGLYDALGFSHEDVMREEPKCNVRAFLPQYELSVAAAAAAAEADGSAKRVKKRVSKTKGGASAAPSSSSFPGAAAMSISVSGVDDAAAAATGSEGEWSKMLTATGLDTSLARGDERLAVWVSVDRERFAALGVDVLRVVVKEAAASVSARGQQARGESGAAAAAAADDEAPRVMPLSPRSHSRAVTQQLAAPVASGAPSGGDRDRDTAVLALLQAEEKEAETRSGGGGGGGGASFANESPELGAGDENAPLVARGAAADERRPESVSFAEPSQAAAAGSAPARSALQLTVAPPSPHAASEENAVSIQITPSPRTGGELRSSLKSPKGEEAGSVHSGSSSNTGISLANAMAVLRRALLSSSGALDPSMKRLRMAFIFTICTLTVLALVTHIFIQGEVTRLQAILEDALLSNVRLGGMSLLSFSARALILVATGLLPSVPYEEQARSTLARYANQLSGASNQMFFNSRFLDDGHRALYTDEIQLQFLLDGRIANTSSTWLDAVNDYAAQALMLRELPLSRIDATNSHAFFILRNFESVFAPANKSGEFFSAYLERSAASLQLAELAILCAALGLVSFSLLLVFRPAVAQVQATKRDVFQFFYEIPVAIMEDIKEMIMSKTVDFVQNEEEMGGQGEVGGKESEDKHEKAAMLRRQHASKTIVIRQQWGLLAQISLLVVMAIVYFTFVYLFALSNINRGAGTARAVDWAGRRRVLSALMFAETRRAMVYHFLDDPFREASQQVHIERAISLSEFFLRISKQVMYGDEALGLPSATGRSKELDELMFRNACNVMSTPNCTLFHRGVLTQGVSAAISEYARLISTLAATSAHLPNGTVANLSAMFTSETYLTAETMFWDHFLESGLSRVGEIFTQTTVDEIGSAFDLLTSVFAAFFSVSFILLVLLYDPLVKRLNFQLKRTRAMLLMIPTAVIEENRSLRRKLMAAKF